MGAALGNSGNRGCHPAIKYCMAIPMILEIIQYKANPLGKVKEKKAISSGIIHSIIVWLPCCRGSVDGVMVIFCWTQVEINTRIGIKILVGSGSAKSSHRKVEARGAAE